MIRSSVVASLLLASLTTLVVHGQPATFVTGPIQLGCNDNSWNFNCGQNSWGGFVPALFNTLVQTLSSIFLRGGNAILYVDNNVISGGFGFQTIAPVAPVWAGEIDLASSVVTPYGGDTMKMSFDVYFVNSVADGTTVSISDWNNNYDPLEDRDTYLRFQYDSTGAYLYTLDSANGANQQNFYLSPQTWYHIDYWCTFNNGPAVPDPCVTYVDGALVINSTSWKILTHSGGAEPHNYIMFTLRQSPDSLGFPAGGSQGLLFANFAQSIYNISNPEALAYNYSTNFAVDPSNVNGCQQNPVQNGGTCTPAGGTPIGSNGAYTSTCAPGFSGVNCQFSIDECASAPCVNGATCTDGPDSYSCACVAGYSGVNCQTQIDECASSPCPGSCTCVDLLNAYQCNCLCPCSPIF